MDRDTIIDGLRMTMDLYVFDPSAGEEKDPDDLNNLDRATYDACKGALEILERLDTDSDTISRAKAIETVMECYDNDELFEVYEDKLRELPPAPTTEVATDINVGDKDTISRKAAIEEIERWLGYIDDDMVSRMQIGMKRLPSAQPERKEGEWIYHIDDLFPAESTMECNQCHAEQPLTCDDEFCPHCGAKMEVTT